jgi:hypothetical protein
MVAYKSIENATLATVLTALENSSISSERIVNIFHDGSAYVAVYVISS